jgi:hypothetical protein
MVMRVIRTIEHSAPTYEPPIAQLLRITPDSISSHLIKYAPSSYLCLRVANLVEELSRLMDLSDEITLEEEEKNCVCVLFMDLLESLPCLCEVRAIRTPVLICWDDLSK